MQTEFPRKGFNTSSIVIEVIRVFFFFMKRFHIQKKHKKQTNDHIFMYLDA